MNKTLVVDTHQHFWDPGARDYRWLDAEELAPIRRPLGPEDLRPILVDCGVDATIAVQTIPSPHETQDFLAIAAKTDFVAGIVGWVDLTDPQITSVLATIQAGDNGNWLVGIRHQVQDEPDPGWIERKDVIRGIGAVGDAGLVYDLLPRRRELSACLRAVDTHPHTRFVLDHIAKPDIAGGEMEPWSTQIAELAQRPNVFCKLSGMVTEADWSNWDREDLRPYVDFVLQRFGEDRVMFGSDWPVCLLAAEYASVKNTLEYLIGAEPNGVHRKVFGENAISCYKLPGAR